MNTLLLSFATLLSIMINGITPAPQALDSWTVRLNKKTLLSATKEDETANIRKLSFSDWKTADSLTISYKEMSPKKQWERSIFLCDEDDNELLRKDENTKASFSQEEVKKAFAGKKFIRIFTTVSPSDPELAARVRIRRVHLCTIEL